MNIKQLPYGAAILDPMTNHCLLNRIQKSLMHIGQNQWIPLTRMARDFLVVDIAKFKIDPTRNRLDPDKVHASLCLKTFASKKG